MSKNQVIGDRIIAFAVMIQPLLVILQLVMIFVFKMDEKATTNYRVLLTAVPMVAAIIITLRRNSRRFLIVYSISFVLLLLTCILFPENEPFIREQGARFLLPVVIPGALCLFTVKDIKVVEKTLYFISWGTALLVLFYVFNFLKGSFIAETYNMAFSYGCLLPMIVLFAHKKLYDVITSIILFIVVLAIGSRGAALYFLVYVVVDIFRQKSKWRITIITLIAGIIVILPHLYNWFDSVGINSRTMSMFYSGNISNDSGRSSILKLFLAKLSDQPLLGLGLFGDRTVPNIAYCHNLILEIYLNFGIIMGTIIVLFLFTRLVVLYKTSNYENRGRIICYFCAMVLPLMTSGSYLIDSGPATFIGLCFLINKDNRNGIVAT